MLVGLLYVQPLRTYLESRNAVAAQTAEVRALERQHALLERRLVQRTSEASLQREARRLGYVKPGEHLFIVKGIPAWRAAHARRGEGRSRPG